MFVDYGRFALKVSFSPAIFCWLNTQFAHLVFPPPGPQPGLFQELEGGAVPGTHWNWNKEQPLESLHSAAHRLLYRCPVFGGHETLVFIFIFFFLCFLLLSSKVPDLWVSPQLCLSEHHFLLHIKAPLLFRE